MTGKTSTNIGHEKLAAAFSRICVAFSANVKWSMGGLTLSQVEDSVRNDLATLYRSSQSIARDILARKIYGPCSTYSDCHDMDVDNAAADAVADLFGNRKTVRRGSDFPTGVLEIVSVVQSLYEKNPDPTESDIYYWLRRTVQNHVNHLSFRRLREKSPEFASTGRKIGRYINNSKRYECRGRTVADNLIGLDCSEGRMASADEVISMCGGIEPQPACVPETVDLIFDMLAEQLDFRSELPVEDLREAVFRLIEPRLHAWPADVSIRTPWDDYLTGEAEKAGAESLKAASESYSWRKDFSESDKQAFLEAAADCIFDMVYRGGRCQALHKYLAAHIEDCSSEVYETVYKGSAQHFFKHLEDDYRSRLTGSDMKMNRSVKRKEQDADRADGDIDRTGR